MISRADDVRPARARDEGARGCRAGGAAARSTVPVRLGAGRRCDPRGPAVPYRASRRGRRGDGRAAVRSDRWLWPHRRVRDRRRWRTDRSRTAARPSAPQPSAHSVTVLLPPWVTAAAALLSSVTWGSDGATSQVGGSGPRASRRAAPVASATRASALGAALPRRRRGRRRVRDRNVPNDTYTNGSVRREPLLGELVGMFGSYAAAEEGVAHRDPSSGVGERGRRVEQHVVAVGGERVGHRLGRRGELSEHGVVAIGEPCA